MVKEDRSSWSRRLARLFSQSIVEAPILLDQESLELEFSTFSRALSRFGVKKYKPSLEGLEIYSSPTRLDLESARGFAPFSMKGYCIRYEILKSNPRLFVQQQRRR